MSENSTNQLSDSAIDVLRRPKLYGHLLKYISDPINNVIEHEIRLDEEYRHDLVAYRVYKDVSMRWIVAVMAGLTDEFHRLPVGFIVRFPPKPIVASLIRQVKNNA